MAQTKEILLKAKKMQNENRVAFVWTKHSNVFIKTNPNERSQKITNINQLAAEFTDEFVVTVGQRLPAMSIR